MKITKCQHKYKEFKTLYYTHPWGFRVKKTILKCTKCEKKIKREFVNGSRGKK